MFSRTKKGSNNTQESTSKASKSHPPSLISADLHVIGNLKSDGDIHADGNVDGDIMTKVLIVGESASIKGKIIADTVHVHGHVNGEIKARSVNLARTAHVIGDILHEDLSIDAGAFLEGHCKRIIEKKDDVVDVKKSAGVVEVKPIHDGAKSDHDKVKSGQAGKISPKTPSANISQKRITTSTA